jgi:hypothetical protein
MGRPDISSVLTSGPPGSFIFGGCHRNRFHLLLVAVITISSSSTLRRSAAALLQLLKEFPLLVSG